MHTTLAACVLLATSTSCAVADIPAPSPPPSTQKAVLVTGASTGIGRAITERLAAEGYFVYAGARKDADLRELDAIPNVDSLRLDVTSPEEIAAAVTAITQAGRGLHGLVNNAGVAIAGPLVTTKEEDFDFLMDVNLYGPFRVTKAFSPLIIESRGRITNIGSISGTLSRRELGAYSMSKHGIEAFTDALAAEMAPLGVVVNIVEPGNYNTEIAKSAEQRSNMTEPFFGADRSKYKSPDEVAEAVLQALTEPTPRRRYMIVPNQAEAEMTIRKAIQELVQLNEGQRYTYDREALIRMLDEALASARPRVEAPAVVQPAAVKP